MKNICDGVVTTDADGCATVTMPEWFDDPNTRFRHQLTVVGRSFARAVVWDELDGRSFRIRTDEPGGGSAASAAADDAAAELTAAPSPICAPCGAR